MLRDACSVKLANDGVDTWAQQAYLGHRNIQNTTPYTALAPDRVKVGTNWRIAFASIVSRSSVTISVREQSAAVVRASQSRE